MDNEYLNWRVFFLCFALVIMWIAFSITKVNLDTNAKMAAMIEQGADPLDTSCAFSYHDDCQLRMAQ